MSHGSDSISRAFQLIYAMVSVAPASRRPLSLPRNYKIAGKMPALPTTPRNDPAPCHPVRKSPRMCLYLQAASLPVASVFHESVITSCYTESFLRGVRPRGCAHCGGRTQLG